MFTDLTLRPMAGMRRQSLRIRDGAAHQARDGTRGPGIALADTSEMETRADSKCFTPSRRHSRPTLSLFVVDDVGPDKDQPTGSFNTLRITAGNWSGSHRRGPKRLLFAPAKWLPTPWKDSLLAWKIRCTLVPAHAAREVAGYGSARSSATSGQDPRTSGDRDPNGWRTP